MSIAFADHIPLVMLHVVRAGAFFVTAPTFGTQADSRMLRLVLACALGLSTWLISDRGDVAVRGLLDLGMLAAREAMVGLALGFAVAQTIAALSSAGEILSHEMGFAMAQVVDPESGRPMPVMAQFFETIAMLLVFALDLHHDVLRALVGMQEVQPVGRAFDPAPVLAGLSQLVADALTYGLRYAMPVLGVMVVVTVVLVVLARAVPNINLMDFSFGLRILLAMLACLYFLVESMPFVEAMFRDVIARAVGIFEGA